MTKSKPHIKKYSQILPYLNDVFNYERQCDPQFSHELWSAKLGFRSSFMYLVCSGRRFLTMQLIDKLVVYLKLSPAERNHLILLASYQKAKTSDLKTIFMDKILENLDNNETVLDAKKYFKFVSSPHIPLIRMFLSFDDYKGTVAKISQHLKISSEKVKEALLVLEEMGLAEKYTQGSSRTVFWKSSSKALAIPHDNGSVMDLFHHRTMQEAALVSQQVDIFKKFRSIIFAIQPDDHELLLSEIENFISKMKNRFGYNEVAGKHLLKLNLQAYPVTDVIN